MPTQILKRHKRHKLQHTSFTNTETQKAAEQILQQEVDREEEVVEDTSTESVVASSPPLQLELADLQYASSWRLLMKGKVEGTKERSFGGDNEAVARMYTTRAPNQHTPGIPL